MRNFKRCSTRSSRRSDKLRGEEVEEEEDEEKEWRVVKVETREDEEEKITPLLGPGSSGKHLVDRLLLLHDELVVL